MKYQLWTDQPVVIDESRVEKPRDEEAIWEAAVYPIGNGRLGCTAFGEPRRERIQFNQDSLWVGNEDNTGAYQPFGDVYVELPAHASYENYRRALDIERAVQTITYRSGGVNYRREYFASYPAQLIVLRFTADQPGQLSGKVAMGNVHEIPIVAEDHHTLVMRGDTSKFWYWQLVQSDPQRLIANRQYASDKLIVLDFEARVRVLHEGGAVQRAGDKLAFTGCTSLTLLLAAETNYLADRSKGWRGEHPHARVCAQIAGAEKRSYDALLAEHIADYRSLFGRVQLDLGTTPAGIAALPTAERVKAYPGNPPVDRELEVLLYQYARYLMISSSRPGHGALPANLQGIWLINKRPAWRCDFHTDINIQMNYWFVDGANLAECFEPFYRWIDSIREVRKEETRRVLGVKRGWLMRSENGIFGGSTWHIQKGDSAWLCQNLWDHFAFTQDKDYLARYAYPVMKEIAEFWVDHLKELPDGTLVAPGGRSPEHGPVGVDGVTYDQTLCWELFNNTIAASEVLGVDAEFRQELIRQRDRLRGPQIGRWGQLQEWLEDIDDPACDHRHLSHLIGVYPGRQITPTRTPALARAAQVSLLARRDHGAEHPAWSRVWKACLFARLGDGDAAYQELAGLFRKHVYPNLWTVHPPFQIDANCGYAAAVQEMLVQSHQTVAGRPLIHLLPALPKPWGTGAVNGLRARGGLELSFDWQDGVVNAVTIAATRDLKFVVRMNGRDVEQALAAGARVRMTGWRLPPTAGAV